MKIESYSVQTAAQRRSLSFSMTRLTLGAAGATAKGQLAAKNQGQTGRAGATRADRVSLGNRVPQNPKQLKLEILESMLQRITGGKYGLSAQLREAIARTQNSLARAAASMEYTATTFQYEYEAVSYEAQGVINTADGKTISVDISMQMSREFASYAQATLSFGAANAIDPLVINYGGTAASLTNEKFAFDLDADGVLDQISFAGAGSGFLALDKNGDGIINDGSELFGPNTGNGFSELRAHDADGNNWIDENDEIFSKLRIWSKDADGNDQLFALQQLGVGAIYLGDVSTQFSMNDAANNTQGVMRSTSFFLFEEGGAGTVSHIDLTV